MDDYQEVTDAGSLSVFEETVEGFVDCTIVEMQMINRPYLPGVPRVGLARADLRVVLDQGCRIFDLIFVGVFRICRLPFHDLMDGVNCELRASVSLQDPTFSFDNGCIESERFFYRVLPRIEETSLILGQQIPSPYAIPAHLDESGWRQCSNCIEMWDATLDSVYERCPRCRYLTALERDGSHTPSP